MGKQAGFDKINEYPEIVIPSSGRIYISSPKLHDDIVAFKIAIPIGDPAKAVLVAFIEVDQLWKSGAIQEHVLGNDTTRDYILDRRGSLMTKIKGSDYKIGDIMTHMPIARTALTDRDWPTQSSYIGVINELVYGTLTTIPALNWVLISEISASSITDPIWGMLFKIFLVTLLGLTLFVSFVLYLANKTVSSIKQISEAIGLVAKGEYQFVLEHSRIRELNAMATGCNNMAKARHDTENQLKNREMDLAITLNSIGDAVITTDPKGHITRMNPVAEKFTGWSLQEAQGQPIKSIFTIIDVLTRKEIENPVKKVLLSGETIHLNNHTTLIAKDGSEYQIADSAAPIRNENNDILGMVLVFNDVTEQYQLREARGESEKRFRQLAENINEVFWVGSPDWNEIFYISPAYERIWGQNSKDLYSNPRLWIEAVHPDDRDQVLEDIPKDIESIGEYVDFREYRVQKPDGKIHLDQSQSVSHI